MISSALMFAGFAFYSTTCRLHSFTSIVVTGDSFDNIFMYVAVRFSPTYSVMHFTSDYCFAEVSFLYCLFLWVANVDRILIPTC